MSIKFINSEKHNDSKRDYVFTDISLNTKEVSSPVDSPDMELLKELENKNNCCYSVVTEKKDLYFVKMEGSKAFDILQDSNSYRKRNWKFKKVDKYKYDMYIKFLVTKQGKYLSVVERV